MWEPVNETPPCLACEDRHRACHDTCERYKGWKERQEEKKDAIQKAHYPEIYRYRLKSIQEAKAADLRAQKHSWSTSKKRKKGR